MKQFIIENGALIYCVDKNIKEAVIPDGVTSIGNYAFKYFYSLKSVVIPEGVTRIGHGAFCGCKSLQKENKTNIYYKAFNPDMTCRDFQYEIGRSYRMDGYIICCERGFHSCGDIIDVFNYYNGEFDKDLVICEVEIGGKIDREYSDSKVASSDIKILRKLSNKEIIELINR